MLVVVPAWPCIAAAQEPSEAEARARFQSGQDAYGASRWQEALDDFTAAHALSPRPELLYDIARCLERLDRPKDAIDEYQLYLVARPDAAERAEVEHSIEILRLVVANPHAPPLTPPVEIRVAPRRPLVRRWWLWTSIVGGAAVLGLAVGLGVGLRSGPHLGFSPVVVK
jgi:tetratricopeptide (TPR) repeat protein